MNLFKTLAELLKGGLTATIVIKKTTDGRMTVITNFNTETGGVCDSVAPFTLKGTPDELDAGFLDAIRTPAEEVGGLVSNIEAFRKSVKEAEKNAKDTNGKSSPAVDAAKKAELERKRREAEAKARKENFDKAMETAREANAHGNFYTTELLMDFAKTLTDDKKVKASIDKQIKNVLPNKEGFLCNDDEQTAQKALEAFKMNMVKPDSGEETEKPGQEDVKEPEAPADNSGMTSENPAGETAEDMPENDPDNND